MQQSAILVPILQSNWLMMHVSMMMLSYATLLLKSLLAIAFLCISFEQNIYFPIYYYDTKPSIFSFLRKDIFMRDGINTCKCLEGSTLDQKHSQEKLKRPSTSGFLYSKPT
jgi:hypothetical protein